MPRVCWQAVPDGRYWIDIALGAYDARLMIDIGMIDPRNQVGFELEPALYDLLVQRNQIQPKIPKKRRDSSGNIVTLDSGEVVAQLIDPTSRRRIGPRVTVDIVRSFPRIPNRVGVVFFHHLVDCSINWNLNTRMWCVDCP
jgi:hypothetical protein